MSTRHLRIREPLPDGARGRALGDPPGRGVHEGLPPDLCGVPRPGRQLYIDEYNARVAAARRGAARAGVARAEPGAQPACSSRTIVGIFVLSFAVFAASLAGATRLARLTSGGAPRAPQPRSRPRRARSRTACRSRPAPPARRAKATFTLIRAYATAPGSRSGSAARAGRRSSAARSISGHRSLKYGLQRCARSGCASAGRSRSSYRSAPPRQRPARHAGEPAADARRPARRLNG